jgi:hypothetical protein
MASKKIDKRRSGRIALGGAGPDRLLHDVRRLIAESRRQAATAVNAGLTLLYWRIGKRIGAEVLGGRRATYGEEIIASLSRQLEAEYGSGFAEKNLRRMVQFAEVFSDEQIVVSLIRQLSWTHFIALIPLKERLRRNAGQISELLGHVDDLRVRRPVFRL